MLPLFFRWHESASNPTEVAVSDGGGKLGDLLRCRNQLNPEDARSCQNWESSEPSRRYMSAELGL